MTPNKLCQFLLLLLLSSLSGNQLAAAQLKLSQEEQNFLAELKTLKLCVGPDSLPLDDIQNGEHIGIGAEYMQLFQQQIGIPISLVETVTWEQSLELVKQGSCQIIALAAQTPQREEFLYFSQSFVQIPFVVVTTQEKFFVSTLSQLSNKELGVHKGYAYIDLLNNRHPDISLIEFNSRKEGLEAVSQGHVFGYLSGLHLAGYAIQTGGYTNLKINGQFDELSIIELGIGIRKEYPMLLEIFNRAINTISKTEKQRIESSWLTVRYEIVEDHQRIIQFAIIASVILLFLLYRQYYLRKHNFEMAKREKEIWRQANFDWLTGLPNRRLFHDRLEQHIMLTKRNTEQFALLLIDLDAFKEVNDTLGHDQGDQLLIEASRRIKNCLRQSDTIARLGGDEFVVILNEVKSDSCVEIVTQKILDNIKPPFMLKEQAFVSASIGITLCPKDSVDMVELLKNADQAMYAAKESGRNNFHYFTQQMQQAAIDRMVLVKDLRIAIEEQQFEVFYQPIIDLKSGKTYKAEALIRWKHPQKGFISPVEFIPTLEETRMIIEVGEWIFIESIKQAKQWREKFSIDFQISVNVSPIQFQTKSTRGWYQLIKELGVNTQAIGIEITESMLMEGQDNISNDLIDLRYTGFQVSLDDFGTGYSSLSYLKKFDIDYLKIDKSFVDNLTEHSDDMVLCEAIIIMAHRLGLKVIAEGVETEQQKQLLSHSGCDFGQGYWFAKPLPADEFEKLLEKQNGQKLTIDK